MLVFLLLLFILGDFQKQKLYAGSGVTSQVNSSTLSPGQHMVVSPSGDEIYLFDPQSRHAQTISSLTGSIIYTFSYNTAGLLSSIQDASGNSTTFNRNGSGQLLSVQGPYGQTTSFTLNSDNLITSVTNPKSEVYSMTYYPGTELLKTFTKPSGRVSTFTYDAIGRIAKDSANAGDFKEFLRVLGESNESISQTTALGRTSSYANAKNVSGATISTTKPSGAVTTTSSGQAYSYRIETGVTSSFNSVNDERLPGYRRPSTASVTIAGVNSSTTYAQTLSPSAPTDLFTFTSVTKSTTINGNTWSTVFDAALKKFTTTSPQGATSQTG
ncbi:MAG: RHS repeat protein, partial [Proteobacteria bacterium]